MSEFAGLLQIARQATAIAKEEILLHYGEAVQVEWKPDNTPVTIADRNAEQKVRAFLERETPSFGFIGEEFGRTNSDAEYQWILDPIDGTKSFVRGVPLFGTILGLYHRDRSIVGVISLPALQSELSAAVGEGAHVDGRIAKVSSVSHLDQATVLSGTMNTMEARGFGDSFARLRRASQLYRGWGDCYGYYLVACGRAELMVDPVVSIWDIAAMPVIFSEAGGAFSQINGNTRLLDSSGNILAGTDGFTGMASNGLLHNKAIEYLNSKE